jgi:hypothetical protein
MTDRHAVGHRAEPRSDYSRSRENGAQRVRPACFVAAYHHELARVHVQRDVVQQTQAKAGTAVARADFLSKLTNGKYDSRRRRDW